MTKQWNLAVVSAALATPLAANGGIGTVQKIDDMQGGLLPVLQDGDAFGTSVATIGDLDGNGVVDLVVGVAESDLSGPDSGHVRTLFMAPDGTVMAESGFSGFDLGFGPNQSNLGRSVTGLGDVDGDGVPDVAVGYSGVAAGLVRVVLLNGNGTWKADAIHFDGNSSWGAAVAGVGDYNGNGIFDMAVGAPDAFNAGTGETCGVVELVSLAATGVQIDSKVLSEGVNGFTGDLDLGDEFGASIASIGDVDGDGVDDIAVGAPGDDDGSMDAGAVWVLFLTPLGNVHDHAKISATEGNLGAFLGAEARFGESITDAGDFDGDGIPDLVVGTTTESGRFWMLFLDSNGKVRSTVEYDGSWAGAAGDEAYASDLAVLNDLDGNGYPELVAGAPQSDGGGVGRGGIYVLFHEGVSDAKRETYGCGQNPAGSFMTSDLPRLGTTMTFSIDNLAGSQAPFATFPIYVVSLDTSLPAGNCGVAMPGWNLDPLQPVGELLALPNWALVSDVGEVWKGPGSPVEMTLPIPSDPVLFGISAVVQGFLADVSAGAQVPFGLTRAVKLTVGI